MTGSSDSLAGASKLTDLAVGSAGRLILGFLLEYFPRLLPNHVPQLFLDLLLQEEVGEHRIRTGHAAGRLGGLDDEAGRHPRSRVEA